MKRPDEKATKVYTRCETCGKIMPPQPGHELPDGWLAVELPGVVSNAPLAVCSPACLQELKKKQ